MKKLFKHLRVIFVLFLLQAMPAAYAYANGAVFHQGTESGSPMPVKQTELYLSKEHVVFKKDEVVAKFWVNNPSKNDISVRMGFPLKNGYGQKDDKERIDYFNSMTSKIKVTSNNKTLKYEIKENDGEFYRLIIMWDMTFPPGDLTEFIVTYPKDSTWQSADGLGESFNFSYITNTGSYWARPIEDATFEYYDKELIDFITTFPSGEWWSDNDTLIDVTYSISPQPYTLDQKTGKIVWNRHNWVPKKNRDEINVKIGWKYKFEYEQREVDGAGDWRSNLDRWCGQPEPTKEADSKQFAEVIGLETTKFDNKLFTIGLGNKSKLYGGIYYQAELYGSTRGVLPAYKHINIAFKLELLRYLRNYIAARHGHVFKDGNFADCFANIKQKKNWADTEKANLELIKQLETELSREYNKALKELEYSKIDFEFFRRAMGF
jgi:hypothetical protein